MVDGGQREASSRRALIKEWVCGRRAAWADYISKRGEGRSVLEVSQQRWEGQPRPAAGLCRSRMFLWLAAGWMGGHGLAGPGTWGHMVIAALTSGARRRAGVQWAHPGRPRPALRPSAPSMISRVSDSRRTDGARKGGGRPIGPALGARPRRFDSRSRSSSLLPAFAGCSPISACDRLPLAVIAPARHLILARRPIGRQRLSRHPRRPPRPCRRRTSEDQIAVKISIHAFCRRPFGPRQRRPAWVCRVRPAREPGQRNSWRAGQAFAAWVGVETKGPPPTAAAGGCLRAGDCAGVRGTSRSLRC